MSKYAQLDSAAFREEKYLLEALGEIGYHPEVHPEGAKLNSYNSEQEAKIAHVIIRRRERNCFSQASLRRRSLLPEGERQK